MGSWHTVGQELASRAATAVVSVRGAGVCELSLVLHDGFLPVTEAVWTIDPRAPALAQDLTRRMVLQTLAPPRSAFTGEIRLVTATGRVLMGSRVSIDG